MNTMDMMENSINSKGEKSQYQSHDHEYINHLNKKELKNDGCNNDGNDALDHGSKRDKDGNNNNRFVESNYNNHYEERGKHYSATKKTSIIVTIIFIALQIALIAIGIFFMIVAIRLSKTNAIEKFFITTNGNDNHDQIIYWIFGIGMILIFIGVTGIVSCLDRRKILALVYMVILFGLLIGATQKANKLYKQLDKEESIFSTRWDIFADNSKQLIQKWVREWKMGNNHEFYNYFNF